MAFGAQILTQSGMVDVFNIPAFQLIHRSNYTVSTGDQNSISLSLNWGSLTGNRFFVLTCYLTNLVGDYSPLVSTNTSPYVTGTLNSISVLLGMSHRIASPGTGNVVEVWGVKI